MSLLLDIKRIFSLAKSKPFYLFQSANVFTLSLLMTTQEAFVDSVDQDQTAQNVQSDL